jgi:outer membrane protein TolC
VKQYRWQQKTGRPSRTLSFTRSLHVPFTSAVLPLLAFSSLLGVAAAQSVSGSSSSGQSSSGQSSSGQSAGQSSASSGGQSSAQTQTIDLQSLASQEEDPYAGSVVQGKATDDVLQLSLDDAIARGIRANYALVRARAQQQATEAATLNSLNDLLPTIKATGSTGVYQFNLASQGFTPAILPELASLIPGLSSSSMNTIVRVDVTQAQATYDETLFSLEDWTRYKASKVQARAAFYNTQSSRGLVVLNVGDAYLESLAYASNIDNQTALLRADEVMLNQVVAEHQAGVVARIDELRARVQYQQQQQNVIAAQNQFDKSLIALKRRIGIPIEQKIQLSDASPYADLETLTPDQARAEAYQNRQDYQGLQQQIDAAVLTRKAARYERLPTIAFNGNYGVTGLTHGLYHDTFSAVGTLSIPLFKEAKFRGDEEVADTSLRNLQQRFANLKGQIDQQLRDSLLDVQTDYELVRVARSNVELASKELEQSNDQFTAGTSDNLPVVQAQATLASAQTQLVQSTLQFNEAKLGLARNLGIVDTQYTTYLHGK